MSTLKPRLYSVSKLSFVSACPCNLLDRVWHEADAALEYKTTKPRIQADRDLGNDCEVATYEQEVAVKFCPFLLAQIGVYPRRLCDILRIQN